MNELENKTNGAGWVADAIIHQYISKKLPTETHYKVRGEIEELLVKWYNRQKEQENEPDQQGI